MATTFRTGGTLGITKKQFLAMSALAEGKTVKEITNDPNIFPGAWSVDANGNYFTTEARQATARRKLREWIADPNCQAAYQAIIKEYAQSYLSASLHLLGKQLADPNPWIAQGAARDMLNRFSSMLGMNEEKQETVIRIEGMPQLGIPEEAEEQYQIEEMTEQMTEEDTSQ